MRMRNAVVVVVVLIAVSTALAQPGGIYEPDPSYEPGQPGPVWGGVNGGAVLLRTAERVYGLVKAASGPIP